MNALTSRLSTAQALVLGLALVGCATALAVTGHISGDAALTTFGLVGGGALGVTGAHVGGSVATTAAGGAQPSPVAPPAPAEPVPAPTNVATIGAAPPAVTG